jgi:predicted TIM-barrel fold metal-dependent hydrolase
MRAPVSVPEPANMPLIDVHQHVIPDIYKSELARVGVLGSGENPWPTWSVARQLELMGELGIDAVLMSIASPGAYFGDVEFTKKLVKTCNEVMAQMVSDRPGKFGAMGFVSLPDVEAACRDVEYALDTLKIDGINLQTHTGRRYLGHPEENELYAELDRRCAVVFVHPQRPSAQNMPQYAFPAGYTELTFDTTRAITNMLYTGILAKYPNIRWIMPHMGGVTPFLLFRLCGLDDDPKVRERIPDGVAAYLRRLYYDVAQSPSPLALRALLEVADPSRIMFGTDYPSARNVEKVMRDTVTAVRTFDGFDDALRRKITAGNAQAILPRFAKLQ